MKTILTLTLFTILLSSVIIVPFQTSYAADLTGLTLKLAITPSKIESGQMEHNIGYVFLVNKLGIPTTFNEDIEIKIKSDNPNVASVPDVIMMEQNSSYARFSINTKDVKGISTITASVDNLVSSQKITVGSDESRLPDDATLNLVLPTENMHINSKMPFSVFMQTSDGTILRATKDIEIKLEYDKNILVPDSDSLVIKKGTYYAIGVVQSGNLVGSAFLRAVQEEFDIDTAKSIRLTSTLPQSVKIEVFPKFMTADIGREIHAFVSLLDADGNPTVAPDDIPLTFFSNNPGMVGKTLDKLIDHKTVIKKGEFGYHLNQKFDLASLISNNIVIGVSAKGYGISTDSFTTVKKIYTIDSDKFTSAKSKLFFDNPYCLKDLKIEYPFKVVMFGPSKVPPNSEFVIGFQLGVLEDDDDDPDTLAEIAEDENCKAFYTYTDDEFTSANFYEVETDVSVCTNEITNEDILSGSTTSDTTSNDDVGDCTLPIVNIDNLKDGAFYPVQGNKVYTATGTFFDKVSMVTSNTNVVSVLDPGTLQSTQSNGFAKVKTGAYSGDAKISSSIKGMGTQTFSVQVINTLEQKGTVVFSPVGENVLLADHEGFIDVFLVALDKSDRPKKQNDDTQYLISPTNTIVEIKKDESFGFSKIKSDILTIDQKLTLEVQQVGGGAAQEIKSKKVFDVQPSSKLQLMLPNENLGTENKNGIGVIQLVDMQGNPIAPSKDINSKVVSSDESVLKILSSPTIPKGYSYSTFDIETEEKISKSTITATARGIIPSSFEMVISPSASNLVVSAGDLPESLKIDEPHEITVYVDDSNQNIVAGARVKASSNDQVVFTPKEVTTGKDGSAKLTITASGGEKAIITLDASKKDYIDATKKITLDIGTLDNSSDPLSSFEFAPWMMYVGIAAAVIVGIFVALFFRKTKEIEEWDEEDDI